MRVCSLSWTGSTGVIVVLAVASAVLACESDPLDTVCTLIGCDSGIEVRLEEEPGVPYRVEAEAPGGTALYVYTCDPTAGCPPIIFSGFTPYRAIFEVIAGSDTTRYEVVPTYTMNQPNGPHCDPTCFNAVIRLPSDAL